ncbi:MAG: Flp pilus assembly complex ATPase component TadA, partial [Lachnospiraceae bacterium]|nr:Flp pilus assembly complex ATPase component TadA [Lachnospiraceae bacterium]
MDILEGFVDKIVFRNEENGYSVLSVICDDEEKTMVGILPYISEGEYIVAEGICSTHMMYGEQFQVKSYRIEAPEDMVSIERYLGSGAIKGIGPVMAARIVKKFKNDTFRIIEEEPERLAEIKGISPRKAQQISESVSEKKEMRDAMMFLQQYGISSNLGLKIYTRYGPNMYNILKENPYRMAEDIAGVGFKIADDIASRMGIYANSEYRIRSAILYILLKAANDGNVCLPVDILLEQTKQLLLIDIEDFESHLTDMMIDKKIVIKETVEAKVVYAAMYYYMELISARMLKDLYVSFKVQEEAVYRRLEAIERHGGIELETEQRKAVVAAMQNGLLVITGGPGTGKTTTINTIIRYFEEEGREVVLAAPTGRAAKRMTETTGYEARTIHRLLEMNGSPEENEHAQFLRDEDNPLDADVVIVDEMSMVDITLIHALLKAITIGTRLILVGDVNQLPSV